MGIVVVIFRRVVPEMRLLSEPEHGNATFQSTTAISCGQFFSCARFVMNIFFFCAKTSSCASVVRTQLIGSIQICFYGEHVSRFRSPDPFGIASVLATAMVVVLVPYESFLV